MIDLITELKKKLRPFVPLFVFRLKRAIFGWRWFRGRYASWDKARVKAIGYDEPRILAKVLSATLEVKAGRAAYERDSVLFFERAVDAELLTCLRQVASQYDGRLRVLDFGGALGSSYWQHRHELSDLVELRWDVVEQAHFVTAGQNHLQDGQLQFFHTLEAALSGANDCAHNVLLASGVIHCLPSPHAVLDQLVRCGVPWMIFHNLPLHSDDSDYVMIQHVPPEIYAATYPVWFLNRRRFLDHFTNRYAVARAYASAAVWIRGWNDYASSGMLLKQVSDPRTQ
jgi:putative methyltransferase (TIGR04325 family)